MIQSLLPYVSELLPLWKGALASLASGTSSLGQRVHFNLILFMHTHKC